MLDIVIASRNRHKVRELIALLPVRGIRWHSLDEFPRVKPAAETGKTFEANAVKKARAMARATGHLALADDSGIEVDALGGLLPGVRSARFAGSHGDDAANNRKLLRLLGERPLPQRRARYRCVLALASPTDLLALAHGAWQGHIAQHPAGRGGFGYDPIFIVPRIGKTVGQLPQRVKQRLSHRAVCARRLRPLLRRLVSAASRRVPAGYRPARARVA